MPTGIEGFDQITGGGLPRHRTTLVMGGPGSGKTLFSLQCLINGARHYNEPGIFVAFEENSRQIIANSAGFGWNPEELMDQGKLYFMDSRVPPDVLTSGQFDLAGMLAILKARADAMGAKRIVFDSIDVLLTLLNNPMLERQELYRVRDWLSDSNLTGIITGKGETLDTPTTTYLEFIPFIVDCVVILYHQLIDRISLRSLRILKYRGSDFAANEVPMGMGENGVEVADITLTEPEYQVFTERIPTGVERLDNMLEGGYFKGSSTLITGSPGAAKTSMAGAFVEAACKRGERALFITFDEGSSELVRSASSIGIYLAPYVKSGLLQIYAGKSGARSSEDHLITIKSLIRAQQPTCMVIDPLSAIVRSGGQVPAVSMAQRLLSFTRRLGITLICTSLLEGNNPTAEESPLQISTLADTWLHLSYVIRSGERNRALTIVKSRGTGHSNQVRELILSHYGITLTDVYTAGGEVLMGTMRLEKEMAEHFEQDRIREEVARRRRELQTSKAEIQARMEVLSRELERQQLSIDRLDSEQTMREEQWLQSREILRRVRGADIDEAAEQPPAKPEKKVTRRKKKAK